MRDDQGELAGLHDYEPRIRDNEQRTATNQPLRGGPAAATKPRPLAREGKA